MTPYDLLNMAGVLALLLYHLFYIREHQALPYGALRSWAAKMRSNGHRGILTADLFWVVVDIVLIGTFQYAPAPFMNKVFGILFRTGANYFGLLFIIPLLMCLYCRIARIDPLRQIDFVTPAFPLALIFAKVGCFTAGCCGDFTWEHGFLNPYSGVPEFPIQLLEAGVALLLFLLLLKIRKRLKPGTVFPVYLMLYCSIRFFTEFLRSEASIWGILKTYHFLCLAGIVAGIAEYRLAVTLGQWIRFGQDQETAEESPTT